MWTPGLGPERSGAMSNREHKYKAWVLGKMYNVECMEWTEYGLVIYTSGGFMTLPDKHVALREYTGLKDKNGIEIYEGDFLDVDEGHRIVEVLWSDVRAMFDTKAVRVNDNGYFRGIPNADWGWRCEVIGNIYEQPELLEEGKHD